MANYFDVSFGLINKISLRIKILKTIKFHYASLMLCFDSLDFKNVKLSNYGIHNKTLAVHPTIFTKAFYLFIIGIPTIFFISNKSQSYQ